jgi:hypothetical protein
MTISTVAAQREVETLVMETYFWLSSCYGVFKTDYFEDALYVQYFTLL